MKRLGATLLGATMILSVLAPANATTAKHPTVSQVIKRLVGTHVYYQNYEATIFQFDQVTMRKWGTRWYPRVYVEQRCDVAQPCPQAAVRFKAKLTPHGWKMIGRHPRLSTADRAAFRHDKDWPWYEFWHWHWSAIWHWTWEHVFKKCIEGAVGFDGTLGATALATKLVVRGGELVRNAMRAAGPQGMAVAAVAGCWFGIASQVLG